jgi:hypothetical protein
MNVKHLNQNEDLVRSFLDLLELVADILVLAHFIVDLRSK